MKGMQDRAHWYRGEHVLVTGGLGFIGSNLALQLARGGARVTVVDSREPGCGANPFNLDAAERDITVLQGDIGDEKLVAGALLAADVIFNLAGEVSHTHSMLFPERDFRINAQSQLRFLQACARYAKGKRVVYASTRQVYGKPKRLPVAEKHQIMATDYNGVHKYAAGQYHLLLSRLGEIDAVVLRLTNIYGPRMAIGLPCQGFLPVFFRRAMEGKAISVFGDGGQLRDPVYVDDACEAMLLAGAVEAPQQRAVNIGSSSAIHSEFPGRRYCLRCGGSRFRRRGRRSTSGVMCRARSARWRCWDGARGRSSPMGCGGRLATTASSTSTIARRRKGARVRWGTR
jgi:nucleoside-diphosphate-sugar epimerase